MSGDDERQMTHFCIISTGEPFEFGEIKDSLLVDEFVMSSTIEGH